MAFKVHVTVTVRGLRSGLREIKEALVAAKDDVKTALDRLTAAVDRLATGGVGTGGMSEQETADTAAAITTQAQRLEAIPSPTTGNGGTTTAAPQLQR